MRVGLRCMSQVGLSGDYVHILCTVKFRSYITFQDIIIRQSTCSYFAARYLQVYAQPMKFDGQGVLSSAKGFAAIFLFLVGVVSSWVDKHCCSTKIKASTESINMTKKETRGGIESEENDTANKFTRQKIFYTLLFAFVSTSRASLNVASAKFTYPYNISEFVHVLHQFFLHRSNFALFF